MALFRPVFIVFLATRNGRLGVADSVEDVEVPFVFLHLVKELVSINIKVKLGNSSK